MGQPTMSAERWPGRALGTSDAPTPGACAGPARTGSSPPQRTHGPGPATHAAWAVGPPPSAGVFDCDSAQRPATSLITASHRGPFKDRSTTVGTIGAIVTACRPAG